MINGVCFEDLKAMDITMMKRAPALTMVVLNGLDMKCQFEERGCDAVIKYNELANHEKECDFAPTRDAEVQVDMFDTELDSNNNHAQLTAEIDSLKQSLTAAIQREQVLIAKNKELEKVVKDNASNKRRTGPGVICGICGEDVGRTYLGEHTKRHHSG